MYGNFHTVVYGDRATTYGKALWYRTLPCLIYLLFEAQIFFGCQVRYIPTVRTNNSTNKQSLSGMAKISDLPTVRGLVYGSNTIFLARKLDVCFLP